jgi:hypothetical protein
VRGVGNCRDYDLPHGHPRCPLLSEDKFALMADIGRKAADAPGINARPTMRYQAVLGFGRRKFAGHLAIPIRVEDWQFLP